MPPGDAGVYPPELWSVPRAAETCALDISFGTGVS